MARVTVPGSIAAAVLVAAALTTSAPASTATAAPAGQDAQAAPGQGPQAAPGPGRQDQADAAPDASDQADAAAVAAIIQVVTANGSGCPPGTSSVALTPGGAGFTVTYSAFRAATGAGATPTQVRRNCQLSLQLRHPAGVTFALTSVGYRGGAHLAAGATGLLRTSVYVQGESATGRVDHTFTGPSDGAWETVEVLDPASLSWAPCGGQRNLNVNTELRVSAGAADPATTSWLTLRAAQVSSLGFAWRPCG